MAKTLILQCPKCKNRMKYMGRAFVIAGKRKACVYCGTSFSVKDNIVGSGQ